MCSHCNSRRAETAPHLGERAPLRGRPVRKLVQRLLKLGALLRVVRLHRRPVAMEELPPALVLGRVRVRPAVRRAVRVVHRIGAAVFRAQEAGGRRVQPCREVVPADEGRRIRRPASAWLQG